MKHWIKRLLLPFALIMIVSLLTWGLIWQNFVESERAEQIRITATLLGNVAESEPEISESELIHAVRGDKTAANINYEQGMEILEKYGLLAGDYATPLFKNSLVRLGLYVGGFLLIVITLIFGYFSFLTYQRQRNVKKLVNYLHNLKECIYDLRPDDNTEDELSLLTNELYKITVLLKETAENNHQHSENLESALADISHQLRTPLTAVQVMVDNIHDDPTMLPAVRQDFLRAINRQVELMSSLVTTLLHLARFDNGKIKLHPKQVKIGELLHSVTNQLAILADSSNVSLRLSGALDAHIRLDPRWQSEALANIIKNAIEHSPSSSEVVIHCEDCPLFLKITIQDSGSGMSKVVQRHIFERFYKAPGSDQEGIGIGLAFAKTIIEAGQGQLSLQSAPGKGAKFSIVYFK